MGALEDKLKTVCEKLNQEKQVYLMENKKIAEELLEIKGLLVKVMGAAEQEEKAMGENKQGGEKWYMLFFMHLGIDIGDGQFFKGIRRYGMYGHAL